MKNLKHHRANAPGMTVITILAIIAILGMMLVMSGGGTGRIYGGDLKDVPFPYLEGRYVGTDLDTHPGYEDPAYQTGTPYRTYSREPRQIYSYARTNGYPDYYYESRITGRAAHPLPPTVIECTDVRGMEKLNPPGAHIRITCPGIENIPLADVTWVINDPSGGIEACPANSPGKCPGNIVYGQALRFEGVSTSSRAQVAQGIIFKKPNGQIEITASAINTEPYIVQDGFVAGKIIIETVPQIIFEYRGDARSTRFGETAIRT